jgi:hypothetical protein
MLDGRCMPRLSPEETSMTIHRRLAACGAATACRTSGPIHRTLP